METVFCDIPAKLVKLSSKKDKIKISVIAKDTNEWLNCYLSYKKALALYEALATALDGVERDKN